MAEKRVIVYRTTDPIQADMLGALLRENDIAARVLGTRHLAPAPAPSGAEPALVPAVQPAH